MGAFDDEVADHDVGALVDPEMAPVAGTLGPRDDPCPLPVEDEVVAVGELERAVDPVVRARAELDDPSVGHAREEQVQCIGHVGGTARVDGHRRKHRVRVAGLQSVARERRPSRARRGPSAGSRVQAPISSTTSRRGNRRARGEGTAPSRHHPSRGACHDAAVGPRPEAWRAEASMYGSTDGATAPTYVGWFDGGRWSSPRIAS